MCGIAIELFYILYYFLFSVVLLQYVQAKGEYNVFAKAAKVRFEGLYIFKIMYIALFFDIVCILKF